MRHFTPTLKTWTAVAAASLLAACAGLPAPPAAAPSTAAPIGEVKGTAVVHTPASARAVMDNATLVLPASVTGAGIYAGPLRDAPATRGARVPVVVFLHGSSGLGLKAIGEWQRWLAGQDIASVAPDSFALPDRIVYKSPVSRAVYEQVHALRLSEVALATQALRRQPWADTARLVLAGTSEGAAAVARHDGAGFAGRIIYSWSCEDNYFVQAHRSVLPPDRPVLNVISSTDPYFSPANAWLGNPAAKGHCGDALRAHKSASIVLIPGAPHTVLNLPPARHATAGFLREVFRLE